jgi:hypothetical protein
MKLTSIKINEADREKTKSAELIDAPAYPYGMCLRLEEATIAKLEIATLPKVGEKMMVMARVEVSETSQRDVVGGSPQRSISLQITDLAIGADVKDKDHATTLYGG